MEIMSPLNHTSDIKSAIFSDDEKYFLTVGYDKKIIFWETKTGNKLRELISEKDILTSGINSTNDYIYYVTNDFIIHKYDIGQSEHLKYQYDSVFCKYWNTLQPIVPKYTDTANYQFLDFEGILNDKIVYNINLATHYHLDFNIKTGINKITYSYKLEDYDEWIESIILQKKSLSNKLIWPLFSENGIFFIDSNNCLSQLYKNYKYKKLACFDIIVYPYFFPNGNSEKLFIESTDYLSFISYDIKSNSYDVIYLKDTLHGYIILSKTGNFLVNFFNDSFQLLEKKHGFYETLYSSNNKQQIEIGAIFETDNKGIIVNYYANGDKNRFFSTYIPFTFNNNSKFKNTLFNEDQSIFWYKKDIRYGWQSYTNNWFIYLLNDSLIILNKWKNTLDTIIIDYAQREKNSFEPYIPDVLYGRFSEDGNYFIIYDPSNRSEGIGNIFCYLIDLTKKEIQKIEAESILSEYTYKIITAFDQNFINFKYEVSSKEFDPDGGSYTNVLFLSSIYNIKLAKFSEFYLDDYNGNRVKIYNNTIFRKTMNSIRPFMNSIDFIINYSHKYLFNPENPYWISDNYIISYDNYRLSNLEIQLDEGESLESIDVKSNYIHIFKYGYKKIDRPRARYAIPVNNITINKPFNNIYFIDSTNFITRNNDNTISMFNVYKKEELATIYLLQNGAWIAITPNGLWDGSEGALNQMYYSIGKEIINFKNVNYELTHQTDLLGILLGKTHGDLKTLPYNKNWSTPPKITITPETKNEKKELIITLDKECFGKPIVWQNGIKLNDKDIDSTENRTIFKLSLEKLSFYRTSDTILYEISSRSIDRRLCSESVFYSYIKNNELQMGVDNSDSNNEVSKKNITNFYGVFIGTSNYRPDGLIDLPSPAKDAASIKNILESSAKKFASNTNATIDFRLFTDTMSNYSKENIIKTINEFKLKSTDNDVFVVFMTGHGAYENGEFYYLLKNALKDGFMSDSSSFINSSEIKSWTEPGVSSIKANKKIMIIDACHSGGILNGMGNDDIDNLFYQINNEWGIKVIAASKAEQSAFDDNRLGHTVLSYALLKSLQSTKYINYIDIDNWILNTTNEIKNLGYTQTPVIMIKGESFLIGKIDSAINTELDDLILNASTKLTTIKDIRILPFDYLGLDTLNIKEKLILNFSQNHKNKVKIDLYGQSKNDFIISGRYNINEAQNTIIFDLSIRNGLGTTYYLKQPFSLINYIDLLTKEIIEKFID